MSGEKGICFLCHRKVRHKNKRDGEELSLKESNTQDLTIGRPIVQILLFAIPLVLGTLFQQLYSFVDTVIVGRFIGADALAAVGTTYSLNFLILGFAQGLCVGFGIFGICYWCGSDAGSDQQSGQCSSCRTDSRRKNSSDVYTSYGKCGYGDGHLCGAELWCKKD